MNIRYLLLELCYFVRNGSVCGSSLHSFKDIVRCMLNRYIKIIAYLVIFSDCLYQLIGNSVLIAVHKPYPPDAVYLTKLFQKLRQSVFTVKVIAVIGRILRYQYKLSAACLCQRFGLCYNRFLSFASVVSAYKRNNAVGASVIAALRYFECSAVHAAVRSDFNLRQLCFGA